MLQPPRQQKHRLGVRAADEATEINVQDGRLRSVAQGRGTLELTLDPGVYKVIGRSGDARFETLVLLQDKDEEVRIPRLQFSSSAPLEATRSFDPVLADAARQLAGARPVHAERLGAGSAIFFCTRDVTHPGAGGAPPAGHPMTGLALCNARGVVLQSLPEVAEVRRHWAARTIQVAPGTYRLRLELPTGAVLEQVLVASAGWMTQVFLTRKSYGEGPDSYRADLANAAIFLTLNVPEAFNPSDRDARLTDLARQGLAQGRQVLSDAALREIFEGKFRNPMLGILGAHLLLLECVPDFNPRDNRTPSQVLREHLDRRIHQLFGGGVTLRTLVTNLRHIFNMKPHPDVEALALLLGDAAPTDSVFCSPPMLHQSWALIVEATARDPSLVPEDCVSADVALHVLNQNPWLLLWTPAGDPATREQRVAQYQQAIQDTLTPPDMITRATRGLPAGPGAMPAQAVVMAGPRDGGVPTAQGAAPAGAYPTAPSKSMPAAQAPVPPRPTSGDQVDADEDDDNARNLEAPGRLPETSHERQELVRMLGLPLSSIKQLAKQKRGPQ